MSLVNTKVLVGGNFSTMGPAPLIGATSGSSSLLYGRPVNFIRTAPIRAQSGTSMTRFLLASVVDCCRIGDVLLLRMPRRVSFGDGITAGGGRCVPDSLLWSLLDDWWVWLLEPGTAEAQRVASCPLGGLAEQIELLGSLGPGWLPQISQGECSFASLAIQPV
jgi:hypothetical protein